VFTEHLCLPIFVAGCDQFFESKFREIQVKVAKEIADGGIVAIAVNSLAAKMLPVML
jgi:hypothetical protein